MGNNGEDMGVGVCMWCCVCVCVFLAVAVRVCREDMQFKRKKTWMGTVNGECFFLIFLIS